MDDVNPMKLDAIDLSKKKKTFGVSVNTVKALRQRLRKFFNEEDGHGSLIRKPPPALVTPQYFKILNLTSYYPIPRVNWLAFVNTQNYKKKFTAADNPTQVERPCEIINAE